jgi:outer membrane protein assembly factor BamB
MSISPRWTIALVMLSAACSHEAGPSAGGTAKAQQETSGGTESKAAAAVVPAGPYWPRFHGPDAQNKSADTGLLREWPKSGPKLLWTAKGLGHGFAGVTLAGGLIYTDGNRDDKTVVTAMDLDGNVKWQTPNGPAWTKSVEGSRGTPTYDGGRVYHESPLGELICLDAKTGDRVWGLNILKQFGGRNIEWGLAESVLIDGDRLICCPGGTKGSVVALDKRTGEKVWASPDTGKPPSYASPALAVCGGLRMILTMNAKSLIGVNADTGELLFEFPHVTEYDVNALMPIYHDGHIFISSGYGSGSALLKVAVDGDKAAVEQVWESKELDNHHGGVLRLDGYLYGAAHNANRANWICLDWKTGQKKCAEPGVGKGSLTWADGMLYTLSENRKVGLVKPSPGGHKVVSQFMIPSGGEGPTWAHPVVCGGRLYVRHSDKLFAYDVKGK